MLNNHTTLELFSCAAGLAKFAVELSGVLKGYTYPGVAGLTVCIVINGGTLVLAWSYGVGACVIVHTLDRYWKIVHPIHHRKYYRRWMMKVGIALPWLLGFASKVVQAIATARIVNGVCVPQLWPSKFAYQVCPRNID